MKKELFKGILIFSLTILLIFPNLFSAVKGTLRVQVLDTEGNILPGAAVSISSPDMMGIKSLTANEKGEVVFISLIPSVYEVKTTLQGFQEVISKSVRVKLDEETLLRVELTIAPIEESLTVVAEYPAVDTKTTTISEHVTSDLVESLPVARDFVGYVQLVSGANMIPNSGGRDTGNDPVGKGGINYNARNATLGGSDNLYSLEGVDITGMSSQQAGMTFNDEVIQEEQVITSGATAEYGGGKGVITNIITKSGGNRFSGSLNYYLQKESFWGKFNGLAAEDSRLQTYKDDKYDTAATLGGPILKDKLWFFVSGQYRNNSSEFQLTEIASPTQETTDFSEKRYNGFGKLTFQPTGRDLLSFIFFRDQYDILGSRSVNSPIGRQSVTKNHYTSYSANYQRIFGVNSILTVNYGHYEVANKREPRFPEAGAFEDLRFLPGARPYAYEAQLGTSPTVSDNKSTRDQYSVSYEHFLGNMRLKAGVSYINESDRSYSHIIGNEQLTSLAPYLSGSSLMDLVNIGLYSYSDFRNLILPKLNSQWDSTSEYYDLNHDGVVTEEELGTATFTAQSPNGVYLMRWFEEHEGKNTVRARRWTGYIIDDWRISKEWTLNAGIRFENHNYLDSNGDELLHMKTELLPRIGLSWDIGGRGKQKLSLFYGHYTDPMDFRRIHNAGDISGQVRVQDLWLANDWYTIKRVGSVEKRGFLFAAGLKDQLSRELSLTYEQDLGNQFSLAAQAYYRGDRRIVEDVDCFLYCETMVGDPLWGHLALSWEEFGYPASGPPEGATYFIGNLVGAKRDTYGLDFELVKRFTNGSNITVQYSFKDAKGNSVSDKEALHYGDMPEIDPRNPWMWGPLPGTIPHILKLFGTYRSPIGLNVGAIFYWQSGIVYTESYMQKDDYMNWPLNNQWTELVQSGQEHGPSWYNVDLKLSYPLRWRGTSLELFLDVYNLTDNQAGWFVEPSRNNAQWDYQQINRVLSPRRIYLGARFRF
ncbi:MAG: TonB-dependent receptor [Candidatus Aminicenantes bacterium]|nr:TonB-dependent receptor [Candidatus Aminicenantes bacterium]